MVEKEAAVILRFLLFLSILVIDLYRLSESQFVEPLRLLPLRYIYTKLIMKFHLC
jgi:hypothetical protein